MTCEDFVLCMEEASGADLTQFRLWYSQAGTPKVTARVDHDAAAGRATLHLTQAIPDTPGQTGKAAMVLPLKVALIGRDSGEELGAEQLVLLDRPAMTVTFDGVGEAPLLSINRNFSAPAVIEVARAAGELERLAEVDGDPFARSRHYRNDYARLAGGARGEVIDPAPVSSAMGRRWVERLDRVKAEALIMPRKRIGDRLAFRSGGNPRRRCLAPAIARAGGTGSGAWQTARETIFRRARRLAAATGFRCASRGGVARAAGLPRRIDAPTMTTARRAERADRARRARGAGGVRHFHALSGDAWLSPNVRAAAAAPRRKLWRWSRDCAHPDSA